MLMLQGCWPAALRCTPRLWMCGVDWGSLFLCLPCRLPRRHLSPHPLRSATWMPSLPLSPLPVPLWTVFGTIPRLGLPSCLVRLPFQAPPLSLAPLPCPAPPSCLLGPLCGLPPPLLFLPPLLCPRVSPPHLLGTLSPPSVPLVPLLSPSPACALLVPSGAA